MNLFKTKYKGLFSFGFSVIAVLIVTAILEPHFDQTSTVTVALSFLLLVLFSATFFGRNSALLASFAAMLCFNYFFLPPVRTWRIADSQNLMAWAAFTITAIITGELSAYARRRAAEAERQKVEIETLYRKLQNAFEKAAETEALERSEKLKSALLDAVTHDLRTPLTSIKASVTTLLDSEDGNRAIELDNKSRLEFLDVINEETDRLNDFIEEMVEMARVDASVRNTEKGSSDLNEALSLGLERARRLLRRHKIVLNTKKASSRTNIDLGALAQVIYTLLENSAKYSPPGSTITLGSRDMGETLEVSITDEGTGIPPDMRERVFEKFFRLGKKPGGLGLGLSIARGIIDSNEGTIRIETGESGTGTKVIFTVPAGNKNDRFEEDSDRR